MHAIGVYANSQKPDVLPVARMLIDACEKSGRRAVLEPWLYRALGDARARCEACVGQGVDVLAVLGGDGTLLRAMPYAVQAGIPLLGINLGRVGFLTEVDPNLGEAEGGDSRVLQVRQAEALDQAVRALVSGEFAVEERMLLSVSAPGQRERLALNDAVIAREASGGMLGMDAYLDGALIDHYSADGLIVSTPTGSTAYSLSAGGPIVAPDVACMVLAPICPHSLHARPMVLSPNGELRVHIRAVHSADSALLTTDGQAPLPLACGTDIRVRRAQATAHFVRLRTPSFFTLLRTKLSEWSV